jgi:divalent metal cation (Fe/Co/Zn/Cd) transporter
MLYRWCALCVDFSLPARSPANFPQQSTFLQLIRRGWLLLDPIIALLVAINILWTGVHLVRRSVDGLMDAALPKAEQKIIETVVAKFRIRKVDFHALRTRQAASRRFFSVHMLVPGDWTVHDAHHIAEDFEGDIRAVLGDAVVSTHLEPIDDEIYIFDNNEK